MRTAERLTSTKQSSRGFLEWMAAGARDQTMQRTEAHESGSRWAWARRIGGS